MPPFPPPLMTLRAPDMPPPIVVLPAALTQTPTYPLPTAFVPMRLPRRTVLVVAAPVT